MSASAERRGVLQLLDTSMLVAALEMGHPHHKAAWPYLEKALAGETTLAISTHALAETFATLTALPVTPRVTPAEAERIVRETVLPIAQVVPLTAEDYAAVLARIGGLGLGSGAVYDALHVRAAEIAGCDELVTFNVRDFRRMPPAPPTRLVIPETE